MMMSKPIKMAELKRPVMFSFLLSTSTALSISLIDYLYKISFDNAVILILIVFIVCYLGMFGLVFSEIDEYKKRKIISALSEEKM